MEKCIFNKTNHSPPDVELRELQLQVVHMGEVMWKLSTMERGYHEFPTNRKPEKNFLKRCSRLLFHDTLWWALISNRAPNMIKLITDETLNWFHQFYLSIAQQPRHYTSDSWCTHIKSHCALKSSAESAQQSESREEEGAKANLPAIKRMYNLK